MKTLYIILKPLLGSETRSLKVIEVVENKLSIILDKYIDKGEEVNNFTQKDIERFVSSIITDDFIEFIYL